jgi:peroxiredoxin
VIKVGERLPAGTFRVKNADDTVRQVTTAELFDGQRVVFIGVPGAFTSTCHHSHVPQFIDNAQAIKAKGIDRIVVMAVNDHHVLKEWRKSFDGGERLDFVADGEGAYARALGLEVDMSATGLGRRVRRFSALVDDGIVRTLNFEPEGGKGVQATGAAAMLGQIG